MTARVAAAFVLLGVVAHAAAQESHRFRFLMGTSIEVQAFGGDEPTRRAAIDQAFAAFVDVDRLMSNYRDDSELAGVNRSAEMFFCFNAVQRRGCDSTVILPGKA